MVGQYQKKISWDKEEEAKWYVDGRIWANTKSIELGYKGVEMNVESRL